MAITNPAPALVWHLTWCSAPAAFPAVSVLWLSVLYPIGYQQYLLVAVVLGGRVVAAVVAVA